MAKADDLSKPSVAFDHETTLLAVLELSGTSWLTLAIVPGVDRRPRHKLPVDENTLFKQLEVWRQEARKAGRPDPNSRVTSRHFRVRSGRRSGCPCRDRTGRRGSHAPRSAASARADLGRSVGRPSEGEREPAAA